MVTLCSDLKAWQVGVWSTWPACVLLLWEAHRATNRKAECTAGIVVGVC